MRMAQFPAALSMRLTPLPRAFEIGPLLRHYDRKGQNGPTQLATSYYDSKIVTATVCAANPSC